MLTLSRIARLFLVAAVVGVALLLGRSWPREQTVHYVLGNAAQRVEELDARWARAGDDPDSGGWTRETRFRYEPGEAPRVVTHEPRLPDGEYTVEIEIVAQRERNIGRRPDESGRNVNVVRRRVALAGGATQIDLGPSVPR
jgi:hypothetical protein